MQWRRIPGWAVAHIGKKECGQNCFCSPTYERRPLGHRIPHQVNSVQQIIFSGDVPHRDRGGRLPPLLRTRVRRLLSDQDTDFILTSGHGDKKCTSLPCLIVFFFALHFLVPKVTTRFTFFQKVYWLFLVRYWKALKIERLVHLIFTKKNMKGGQNLLPFPGAG